MQLETLKTFEMLNEEELTIIAGGFVAPNCSHKNDVDCDHGDNGGK